MTDDDRKRCVLRFALLFAGVGWGLSVLFLFWKWESATVAFELMGGRSLKFDPFLFYWMRVIGAIFGCFGIFCFVVSVQTERYRTIIPWIGWLHIIGGLVAGASALEFKMKISDYPNLLAELVFFWTIGIVLVWFTIGSRRGIPSGSCASRK